MNLGKIARFSEEIRPQTARYAMKREVAAVQPVFPLSMSDFKPGDKEYCKDPQAMMGCSGLRCAFRTLNVPGRLIPQVSGFLNAGRGTPGRVDGFSAARQLNIKEAFFSGSQGENQNSHQGV